MVLLQELRQQPDSIDSLLRRLERTLSDAIGKLHSGGAPEKRSLWAWLGDTLPPLLNISEDLSTIEDALKAEPSSAPKTPLPEIKYVNLALSDDLKMDSASLLAESQFFSLFQSPNKQACRLLQNTSL